MSVVCERRTCHHASVLEAVCVTEPELKLPLELPSIALDATPSWFVDDCDAEPLKATFSTELLLPPELLSLMESELPEFPELPRLILKYKRPF